MTQKQPTNQQKDFCEWIIRSDFDKSLTQTQCAINAGYSESNARHQASRMLTKANIIEYISQLRKERAAKFAIETDHITSMFLEVATAKLSDVYDIDRRELKAEEDMKNKAAIRSIKYKCGYGETGMLAWEQTEVTLHNPQPAKDSLAKHFGYYEKDNLQKKPMVNLFMDLSAKEQLEEGALDVH